MTYRQPLNDAKEKISQSCWSLLSKLYLSRNWLQSRPPATGNDQGHGSRQDLQTSHSDTATTHKNTNSNMNMTLNYNHKEKKGIFFYKLSKRSYMRFVTTGGRGIFSKCYVLSEFYALFTFTFTFHRLTKA